MKAMFRPIVIAASIVGLVGCSPFPGGQRRMESFAELTSKQRRDFAKSPNMQLPELRQRLLGLGVGEANLVPAIDDYEEPIFQLDLSAEEYARLEKAELAQLEIDSRYRVRLIDSWQVRDFANYSVVESHGREKAIALQELAANSELDRFPRYVPGRSMTIYARQLEAYCGYRPGEALSVTDGKWLQYENRIVSDVVTAGHESQTHASFACLRRIVYATDLGAHFIGNRPRPGAISS